MEEFIEDQNATFFCNGIAILGSSPLMSIGNILEKNCLVSLIPSGWGLKLFERLPYISLRGHIKSNKDSMHFIRFFYLRVPKRLKKSKQTQKRLKNIGTVLRGRKWQQISLILLHQKNNFKKLAIPFFKVIESSVNAQTLHFYLKKRVIDLLHFLKRNKTSLSWLTGTSSPVSHSYSSYFWLR